MKLNVIISVFVLMVALIGCRAGHQQVLASEESQLKLRSIQTRAFETTDKVITLRNSIATLQDLGFVIDAADDDIGTVSATKLSGYRVRMTVSVRPRGEQMIVRASAEYNMQAIEDPEPYQQFFNALSKSMFLDANEVN